MSNDDVFERLRGLGYSEEDARRLIAEAPATKRQARQQAPAGPAAPRLAGDPGEALATVVDTLAGLLGELVANRNLTPGNHPATLEAHDRLRALQAPAEGETDEGATPAG